MNGFVADTPEKIAFFQLCSLKGALKLEVAGMRRHGQSAYSIAKQRYNLKGSKTSVLAQLQQMVDDQIGGDA